MQTKFIKVTKDNANRDRGFIAVDAICSVFEDQESHNVSIMTMDGFWYDVIDDIEKVYSAMCGNEPQPREFTPKSTKTEFFRKKKMMPSAVENERPKQSHEDFRKAKRIYKSGEPVVDVFQPGDVPSERKAVRPNHRISESLPTGVGEGRTASITQQGDLPMES